MRKPVRLHTLAAVGAALFFGMAHAQQYPILDEAANRVIEKYMNATCEQLWIQKGQAKSMEEQRVIEFLRSDPQIRTMFLNRIAGAVTNKMFECGMIP